MKVRNTNKLAFKQAKLAVLIAVTLGLLFSAIQISFDFKNEKSRVDTTVLQFLSTVRESAAHAAFGLEETLAQRVVSGLFENKSIVRGEIRSDLGSILWTESRESSIHSHHFLFDLLFSDEETPYSIELFVEEQSELIGVLTVWVHSHMAFVDFFDRIVITLLLGLLQSIILAALLMAAFYYLLTKRLVKMTNMFSVFDPKTPNNVKIETPSPDTLDELGVLLTVIGQYVSTQEKHLAELTKSEEQRRLSEQRIKVFAESSSDWFWEADSKGRITWGSDMIDAKSGRAFTNIKNLTREEIAGSLMSDEKWLPYRKAFNDHTDIKGFVYSYLGDDGTIRSAEISGKPVFSEAGEFLGFQGSASDITDRIQSERNLQEALLQAEQANSAKSEFLATMSHEFRTPLNAILGFSEMMRAQYFGPLGSKNYSEYANDIHHSGKHMLALVNDVLDIAAIEAGKRLMSYEDIIVLDLVKDCVRNVEPAALSQEIELTYSVPKNLPTLYADRRSITQIILNLLSNAVKFTQENGVISVMASVEEQNLVFKVIDTGIGILPENLPSITEPFSQSHSDPHKAQDGTGLGLSIVESLITTHDGELNIDSVVGVGTSVTVVLPFQNTNII